MVMCIDGKSQLLPAAENNFIFSYMGIEIFIRLLWYHLKLDFQAFTNAGKAINVIILINAIC